MELLKVIACDQIANGASVAFGLGYFSVGVNGVFSGDDPGWNPGESASNGISLINQTSGDETKIPMSAIAINEPSKLVFVLHSGIAPGDYKIRIATQFANSSTLLKEPRIYDYEFVLPIG